MSLEFILVDCAFHERSEIFILKAGVIIACYADVVAVGQLVFAHYLAVAVVFGDHVLPDEVFLDAHNHFAEGFALVDFCDINEEDLLLFFRHQ